MSANDTPPREPTTKMIELGAIMKNVGSSVDDIWRAMYDAAPKAPLEPPAPPLQFGVMHKCPYCDGILPCEAPLSEPPAPPLAHSDELAAAMAIIRSQAEEIRELKKIMRAAFGIGPAVSHHEIDAALDVVMGVKRSKA